MPFSKLCMSDRLQNTFLNDIKHPELSAVMMQVPAPCGRSKVFVNGPGALTQCQPAYSRNSFALARLEMLENRMG